MTPATMSRYDPIKGCFVLKELTPKPPANAFEWMRFTDEEKERRGGKSLLPNSDYVRSEAATKAVDKKRGRPVKIKEEANDPSNHVPL